MSCEVEHVAKPPEPGRRVHPPRLFLSRATLCGATRARAGGIICLLALLAALGGVARAQDSDESRSEFWPEVDVYVSLSERVRLFFLGTINKSRETKDKLEGQVGAHVDYAPHKKATLRTGYRYGFSLSDGDPFKEHRVVLEQTLRQPLPLDVLLSDRNREDLRWVNGKFSARYRNRVTLEREFKLMNGSLTPYGSAEVYYDSRFKTWNRNRLAVGVQMPLKRGARLIEMIHPKKQYVLDLYFMRQLDSRSQPARVNGLGMAFAFYF